MRRILRSAPFLLLALCLGLGAGTTGCKGKDSASKTEPAAKPGESGDDHAAQAETFDAGTGTTGRHRDQNDWIPAEYKKGRGKWKDAGVYVDGEPLGIVKHGELPLGMTPVWRGNDEPGDPYTQRFRISEYLEKAGVDLRKIKHVHIYGGGLHILEVTGRDFRKHKDGFLFRFGQGRGGKALIHWPPDYKPNTTFDKMSGISVYIDKKPPGLNEDGRAMLDGKRAFGVPYFGEPIRGGVRVYKDDRLALHIKRNKLEESETIAEWTEGKKELRWKLLPFLKKYGVDTSDVVVASVIRDEERFERLSKEDLEGAYFIALPQASGMIELDGEIEVQALALYTRPLPDDKLPQESERK